MKQRFFFTALLFCIAFFYGVTCVAQHESERSASHLPVNKELVTPDALDGTRRLYQFLYDSYGSKIISGVMTLDSFDEVQWLKSNTGKEPALVGLDFMHCGRGYAWYDDNAPGNDALTFYNRNGIPAFCWHWRDPSRQTEEFYSNKTSFNVMKIFEPESAEYDSMIADIDYISGLLKKLQENNIPVIWRPLHEAKGGWFWWGAKGAAACKQLYQIMFNRMVYHHGLNNLIWVWTREPNDELWYPGDEYVDIVSRDIYKEGDHGSQVLEWRETSNIYENKIVALSECGSFPDPNSLVKDGAAWSWFMPWYGSFVRDSKYNALAFWKATLDHEYVITLDEMPDLKTYEPQEHPTVTGVENKKEKPVRVFPTRAKEDITIISTTKIDSLKIISATGQVVITRKAGSSRVQVNVSSLRPGVYTMQADNKYIVRFVKE